MRVRNRTGVIRLEVGDNNRYMTLTVFYLYNKRPKGFEPILDRSDFSLLQKEALIDHTRFLYYY